MARMCRLATRAAVRLPILLRILSAADLNAVIYVTYARRVTRHVRSVRTARFADTRYIVAHCDGVCGTIGARPTCQYALAIGCTEAPLSRVDLSTGAELFARKHRDARGFRTCAYRATVE